MSSSSRSLDLTEFIATIPKTETHLHIEGALPWDFLVKKNPTKFSVQPEFRKPSFRYKDFSQFESILIEHALEIFKTAQDYHDVARSIFRDAILNNVRYLETSFHAGMIEFLRLPGQEILDAILSAVPDGLEVRVFLGISRNAYTDYLAPKLEEAVTSWKGLSGIDLHGPEDLPIEGWTVPLWRKAKSNGMILKAHAGEFGPPSNIEFAIRELGVRRIQHGVRCSESDRLIRMLKEYDICLDMCPISNYKLNVLSEWIKHPLKQFLSEGICGTISTDDPLSFNNSLKAEYMACIEKMEMDWTDLLILAENGFRVADLDAIRKKESIVEINSLRAKLKNEFN